MPIVAEFVSPDGRPVLVEVEPSGAGDAGEDAGMQPVNAGSAARRVRRDLLEVMSDVRPVIDALVSAVGGAVPAFSKVTAKFAFKLSVGGTIVVATGAAEGQFEVTLEWAPKAAAK